jgi:Zn-dependent protease
LDWSWFLIFGLVTFSLASGYLPGAYPELGPAALWLLGALTSILLFGSVLLHELGHAYLARRNGLPVRGISLFVFGGVAQLGAEPRTPGAEFRIAIAGPLVSLALAAFFGAGSTDSSAGRTECLAGADQPPAGSVQHDPRLSVGRGTRATSGDLEGER